MNTTNNNNIPNVVNPIPPKTQNNSKPNPITINDFSFFALYSR